MYIKPIIKYLLDGLNSGEHQFLMEWRRQSDGNAALFSTLIRLRISQQYMKYDNPATVANALRIANLRIRKENASCRRRRIMGYAAVVVLLLAGSYTGWRYFTKPEPFLSIVMGDKEKMKKLSLVDGTVIWLNSGSTLRIPETFTAKRRRIFLSGEAYFDVKKDSLSPFLLQTDFLDIKVLGTSFNVKTDEEKGTASAILVSGKVLLQDKNGQGIFQMSPGEKVIYNSIANRYAVETVDPETYTAWHLDQLIFENTTLREIVNKLSLIYDVNINLQSLQLANRRYRCVLNRDETLEEVLDILSYLAPIRYRIEGNEVFITK